MTTAAPHVGDTLTTAEQLDALPDKAVVLDEHEEPWQKLGEGLWCGRADGPMSGSALLRTRTDEVTVLYVPGEQPGRSTDQALAEAWAEGHRTGWEHCQDGNYGNDHWDDPTPNPYAAAGRAETTTATPPGLTVSEDGSVLNWQGVNYVPQRAETTTATDEDVQTGTFEAILAAHREEYDSDCGMYFGCSCGWDNDDDGSNEGYVEHVAGLLATARTRPTRQQVIDVLREKDPDNHDGWHSPAAHYYEAQADAVLALYADQPTEAEAGARALEDAADEFEAIEQRYAIVHSPVAWLRERADRTRDGAR